MGKELEKEKTVIIDDPMTPVPLNQRQHWTAPAFIFGGLEFSVTLLMIGSTLIGAFGLKGIIPVVLFTFICLTWVGNAISGYMGAKTGLSSSVIAKQGFGDKQAVAFRAKCKMFSRHLQKPILKTEKGRFKGL